MVNQTLLKGIKYSLSTIRRRWVTVFYCTRRNKWRKKMYRRASKIFPFL